MSFETTDPYKPEGYKTIEKNLEWWHQPHHHTALSGLFTDGADPYYAPIVKMESRIETYRCTERMDRQHIVFNEQHTDDPFEGIRMRMEAGLRRNLSYYGLLIDDSLEFSVRRDYDPQRFDAVVLQLTCRAICPTISPLDTLDDAPKRRHCSYCRCFSFEDTYHSGTCENCGGQYDSIST